MLMSFLGDGVKEYVEHVVDFGVGSSSGWKGWIRSDFGGLEGSGGGLSRLPSRQ